MASSFRDSLAADWSSLAAGMHPDPFAILGPHLIQDEAPGVPSAPAAPGVPGVVAEPEAPPAGLAIRAIRPGAHHAEVVIESADQGPAKAGRHDSRPESADDRVALPMTLVHSDGIFELVLDGQTSIFDYRLRFTFGDQHVIEIDDPYRYGRVVSEFDVHLHAEGTFRRAFERMGAHLRSIGEASGVHFVVWAPNADRVSVIGDFNAWDGRVHPMRAIRPGGLWEIFIPGLGEGERYKFEIRTRTGVVVHKTDPYGFMFEPPPNSAAITRSLDRHVWKDEEWIRHRSAANAWLDRPMAIYEVHLASWARVHEEGDRFLSYRELAERLVPYVRDLGYTHIEVLPVMEHPFLGSWGYQVTGFFAPSSRHGSPEDFKYFVDVCHQHGIGLILDWVPGHFPKDWFALARFDGTALYEHEDPRQGEHQDWGTLIFNYGRHEVRNFLLSNALFWLDEYHIDGLRVDAVASMLYLDYSRQAGQWVPNQFGGRENLDAIEFLRQLNLLTHSEKPGSITIAEESTSWPAVSRPLYVGGLGFTYKWNMGWMHDILQYMSKDPVFRRYEHTHITFSMLYQYSENFIVPFSHDEVVHGKGSLLGKMPGDAWQKFANLRTLYGFMYAHPGKKLLFMGGEFGQLREWNHDRGLDWHLLGDPRHAGLQQLVRDLNATYRATGALHEVDYDPSGFQWIDCNDAEHSVVSLIRRGRDPEDFVVLVFNFTPVPRERYRIGVPRAGTYLEFLNSDSAVYGGTNMGNLGALTTIEAASHGYAQSLDLVLPPLAFVLLKPPPPPKQKPEA